MGDLQASSPLDSPASTSTTASQPSPQEQELRQRLKELEIVNAITVSAASTLELTSLLTLAGEKISEAFGRRSVLIALYDAAAGLILTPYWNIRGQLVDAPPMPIGMGLTSHVLQRRQTLLIDENLPQRAAELGADFSMTRVYGMPKSWVGVPMVAHEQVIGMISMQDFEREHAFSPNDIRLLETIAASIAVAIQNTQLYETARRELAERQRAEAQARERAEQMAALNAIGRAITGQLELDNVLTTLRIQCQQIEPLMDVFTVALYEPRAETFKFLQFYDRGVSRLDKIRSIHKKEGGLTAYVIKTRQTLYLPDVDDRRVRRTYSVVHTDKHRHARTYLGIPLMVGENIIGVLSGQSYQPDAFSPQRIAMLETIALQAAIALQNAALFEETRRRAAELSILYDIALALSRAVELERVMRVLFEKCRQVLPMDAFYIALYDRETHLLSHPLFWDKGRFKQTAVRDIRTTPGLSGEVILAKKTLHLPDVFAPEVQQRYQVIRVGGKPTRCYVGVPMLVHGEAVGVISMQTRAPDLYTSEHIRLLELIAIQAAIAIENSRLYHKAQQELEMRRKAQSALETANRQLYVQLTQVQALQEQLREQVLHDPLTGLHNRRYLDEHLPRILADSQARGKRFCVIMLDIDHFKRFNDAHTHLAGDLLLQSLAGLLSTHVRPTDIACRFGGEEFLLVLPEAGLEAAAHRSEELRALFEQMRIEFHGRSLSATISLGVACFPQHGQTAEELVMRADQALYLAKQAGRNRVAIWQPASNGSDTNLEK
ncbi:MAG: diguanylate cyclase [Anaerolineales bacterium]|nr:diguanylate cyclase [Anaerolineales bacterium]MDW8276394.1 diguanylate cyclase [Anaerolineales bacterium]